MKADAFARAGAVALALAVWQAAAMALASPILLPTPWQALQCLGQMAVTADFWQAVGFSFGRIALGFLLGLLAGCLLAVVACRFPAAETLLWPYITVIKAAPVASFIILCLLWLGSRGVSVFISFLMALPLVYLNVLQGLRAADPQHLALAATLGVPLTKKVAGIYLPAVQPFLFSACRMALGLSFKAGIAAEVIGIPDGSLGERLYLAKLYLSSGELFAVTAVILLLSAAFEKLFLWLLGAGYARLYAR